TKGDGEAAADLNLIQGRVVMNHKDMLDGYGESDKSAAPVRLTQGGGDRTHLVIAHNTFVAGKVRGDGVTRAEFNSCCGTNAVDWRAVHHQDIVNKTVSAYWSARPDLVVHQVDAATVSRVAIGRVPLAVNYRVWHARVTACETRTVVIRP